MGQKRVRIATTGTYPQGMASAYRIHCYAKALQQESVQVEVVSTMPKHTYPGKTWGYTAQYDKIPFKIVWNRGKAANRWVNYIRAEINSFILFFHCVFTFRQYEVIWLYGMGLLPRLILIPLLHFAGKRIILELNEYPYSTEGNKYTRIAIVRKILQCSTFQLVIPQADGVVVISENLKKVVQQFTSKTKVLKVPILLDATKATNPLKEEVESPLAHPYLFHAGSLSEQKDGILAMVRAYILAANQLKKINVKLHLVITNSSSLIWNKIESLLIEANLKKQLVITGYLQEKDLHNWICHSTALLINKPPSFQNQYNFPTKLGDYLLSGRPVIVAAQGLELNSYLENDENSYIVAPNNEIAMANKIILVTKQPKLSKTIGNKGKELAKKAFDYHEHASRLHEFLSRI